MKEALIDIDGTLMNRDKTPRQDIINKVRSLSKNNRIVIVSARPTSMRRETREWLSSHFIPYSELKLLRLPHDTRTQVQLKSQLLKDHPNARIAYDDNENIVKMFRKNGLKTKHV